MVKQQHTLKDKLRAKLNELRLQRSGSTGQHSRKESSRLTSRTPKVSELLQALSVDNVQECVQRISNTPTDVQCHRAEIHTPCKSTVATSATTTTDDNINGPGTVASPCSKYDDTCKYTSDMMSSQNSRPAFCIPDVYMS